MQAKTLASRLVMPGMLMGLTALLQATWSLALAHFGLDPALPAVDLARRVVAAVMWLAAALIVIRVVNAFFWGGWVARRAGGDPPRLLTDLVGGIAWGAAAVAVAAWVFGIEVTGLVATSGVAVAVVGFALRGMISDVASGIAMSLERPFRIGDWIESENVSGRVVQVTWRATYLMTRENVVVVMPNGRLAAGTFRHFAAGDSVSFDMVEITLDVGVSGSRAERILLSAAAQVPEIARLPQAPYVRIHACNDAGVVWRLFFPVDDWEMAGRLRYQVQRNLLRNLCYAGVEPAASRRRIIEPDHGDHGRLSAFLRRVDLFASLSDEELERLGRQATMRLVRKGQPVVRQGEHGASLFVLREGLLTVSTRLPNGGERTVAQLTPGSFFGEMSLLTGAPRGASVVPELDSVVMEIGKELLEPLMAARPELATVMSEYLAERQSTTVAALERGPAGGRRDRAGDLLARIRGFFGLDTRTPAGS